MVMMMMAVIIVHTAPAPAAAAQIPISNNFHYTVCRWDALGLLFLFTTSEQGRNFCICQ